MILLSTPFQVVFNYLGASVYVFLPIKLVLLGFVVIVMPQTFSLMSFEG